MEANLHRGLRQRGALARWYHQLTNLAGLAAQALKHEEGDRQWPSKVETESKDYAPRLHRNQGDAGRMLDDYGGNEGVRSLKGLVYASFGR